MMDHLSLGTTKRGGRYGAALTCALALLLAGACGHKMPTDDSDGSIDTGDLATAPGDLATRGDGGANPDMTSRGDGGGGGGDMAPALVCTSNSHWTQGDRGNAQMHPGGACLACHSNRPQAPKLTIAGTVFPTLHEPDDCNGHNNSGPITIEITDATNKVFTLTASSPSGNFLLKDTITPPYSAVVKQGGRSNAMKGKQTMGNCNGCHTATGIPGSAPGRIMIP